ncbi:MAG: acetyl-CoA carboxylase carboxyltransferase subunit alpha/beta [Chloroflexota bacterium]|nr:acetyl-CoA carboxylase carboxyltransferase subunit alpha/beta [Chloroflexota bacterium]
MRNLGDLLVHLFHREGDLSQVYLTVIHDQCLLCEEPISQSEAYLKYRVCPFCRFHYTLSARQRIQLLADPKTFKETHKFLSSVFPLSFSSKGTYQNMLSKSQSRTGLTEAAVTGRCKIDGIEIAIVVLDFGFMGGSMGSVVGEKIALALEEAARKDLPLIALVTGGGTRTQEGVLSLMQMAKTVTAANRLKEKGLPFLVVLANPSTGQAYASFANLADVIFAEPGSLIGLSPLRTLQGLSKQPLPLDAHTSEAHLAHGLLDNVIDREGLHARIATVLKILPGQKSEHDDLKDLLKTEVDPPKEPEAWEAVNVARHAERPSAMVYMRSILEPFVELHGDRLNSDDRSVIGGIGYLLGEPIAIIGQQRRPPINGEKYHVYPDGLRKAQRIINLATRFKLPLITLVDTQGADPGLEAEEQGIGNAIANTLSLMLDVPTPVITVIIGEGGSEGALALGLSDRTLMQQYAIYSPISMNRYFGNNYPEEQTIDRQAAETMMLTAQDCEYLGIIDHVIPEPEMGAHDNPREASRDMQLALTKTLARLSKQSENKLLKNRYKRFRKMGELSTYSQEAMDREVELLLNISTADEFDEDKESGPSQLSLNSTD